MREEVWSSESKLLTHCSRQSYHHINLFRIPSPTGKGIYYSGGRNRGQTEGMVLLCRGTFDKFFE
jgi:hypothetical protein